MIKRALLFPLAFAATAAAADLPIQQVILYKHGVGFFERSGTVQPSETVRLDFKASDMNDVLKSLTVAGRNGEIVGGVRYDASEPLAKRLEEFPFSTGAEMSLAAFLDQMKGARLELRTGAETVAGSIVAARLDKPANGDRTAARELVVLLTDAGDLRTFDLSAATAVKLVDPKLQNKLRDYLSLLSISRSTDKRSLFIDVQGAGARDVVASYMTPAAVWKSAYRLLFGAKEPEPMLEGWAIVDNTSGEDWNNVRLSVVSGRPISFITELYQPRYVDRPRAELAENRATAPVLFEGTLESAARDAIAQNMPMAKAMAPPPSPAQRQNELKDLRSGSVGGFAGGRLSVSGSTVTPDTEGRDLGELFEYGFNSPVTVKQGESAMLPFLNQRVKTRKLLIYSESFGLHPMNAAEVTNSTGKTLDGGPITVYDAGVYAGEALVETLKAGDKRLIGYGVDLGTRVSTLWDSGRAVVREVHFNRGVLTTRSAVDETKTYTIKNVDGAPKTLVVEHRERPGYKLIDLKPSEKTADSYRFEVKISGDASEALKVREQRTYDETIAVSSLTPDLISTWSQNQALSPTARQQLEQILAKKRDISSVDAQIKQIDAEIAGITSDQDRLRRNIDSLRNVAGQQDQVQGYARQLSAGEGKLASLRDSQSDARKRKGAFEGELSSLLEKISF